MQTASPILQRKRQALFADKGLRNKAQAFFEIYGTDRYEKEVDRVRLAILKLSGNDLDKLEHDTRRAKQDFVMCWPGLNIQDIVKSGPLPREPQKISSVKLTDMNMKLGWLNRTNRDFLLNLF